MQFLYNLSWGFVLILVMLGLSLGYTGFFFFASEKKNSIETTQIPFSKRINLMTVVGSILILLGLFATFVKLAA